MIVRPFLDTNVLIYAFASNDRRSAQAEAIVAGGGVISVQVLNEFVDACRRKVHLDWRPIKAALAIMADLLEPPLPLTAAVHERAVGLAQEHAFPFYDSLIVAAALFSDCETILSEDFQDGRKIGKITIRNPFQ